MKKYAPADENGLKPYTLVIWDWAREYRKVMFAENAAEARWAGFGRKRPGAYVKSCKRTLADSPEWIERMAEGDS